MIERLRVAWPHVRAWLIVVHLFAITVMALPSAAGGLRRDAWSEPTVQAEFAAWTARLRALGFEVGQQEVEDLAWDVATRSERARSTVLDPFTPYYRYAGTWQSWKMFIAPHLYPARLEIDVLSKGEWTPVFVERSREYAWLAPQLDHDRFRAAIFRYSWTPYRRTWDQFFRWIAARAHEDFPEARAVRARFWKARSPTPAEVRAGIVPKGEYILNKQQTFPEPAP